MLGQRSRVTLHRLQALDELYQVPIRPRQVVGNAYQVHDQYQHHQCDRYQRQDRQNAHRYLLPVRVSNTSWMAPIRSSMERALSRMPVAVEMVPSRAEMFSVLPAIPTPAWSALAAYRSMCLALLRARCSR